MFNRRVIARLDVKMSHLIKGVQMEGWRKVGIPEERAALYYSQGADELLFMDVVASLYERNNLFGIVEKVAEQAFIPITVGGGIRSLDDVKSLLSVGADKVTLNTAATRRPALIRDVSETYGSQATVLSVEAKRNADGRTWEALTDNGRNHTGLDAVAWAIRGAELGAGEILLTSIDRDGAMKGYDLELIEAVSREVDIPVIAGGGFGAPEHAVAAIRDAKADAVAIARALHSDQTTFQEIKTVFGEANIPTRAVPPEFA